MIGHRGLAISVEIVLNSRVINLSPLGKTARIGDVFVECIRGLVTSVVVSVNMFIVFVG